MTPEQVMQAVARHDERLNQQEKKIDNIESLTTGIYELVANVRTLTDEVKSIRQDMNAGFERQGARIGKLEGKPGQKAEKSQETIKAAAVTALITVLVTAVAMYLWMNAGSYQQMPGLL